MTSIASAQQTAYGALFAAGKSALGARLVGLTGDRGSPQPQEWKFYYLDPSARGGVREITVANREVTSNRTPLRGFSDLGSRAAINLGSLKVDSDRAFQIAEAQAVQRRIAFHWIDYSLQVAADGYPRWTLRLFDNMGVSLGSLEVSAETGAVVSPLTIQNLSPTTIATPRQPVGGLLGTLRDVGVGVGTTVSNTVLRTVGTGQEILTGERTIGPKEETSDTE
ncbi:MAG: hypothetical protein WEB60_12070 [Terrimicrobiaceae bacterium]